MSQAIEKKQECIPVGCVPPAHWPYLVVSAGGACFATHTPCHARALPCPPATHTSPCHTCPCAVHASPCYACPPAKNPHSPLDRILDTRLWKHYPAAIAGSNKTKPQHWKWQKFISITLGDTDGVFTLAWSGTGTGTGTGTWKNGLYGFNKNLSHCTWTGTGKNTWNIFRTWRMGLVPIFQVLKMCPVMNTSVLPCPCSGAVWKVLIKTIQPILPGPCPCPGSGPSQCEYTIKLFPQLLNFKLLCLAFNFCLLMPWLMRHYFSTVWTVSVQSWLCCYLI